MNIRAFTLGTVLLGAASTVYAVAPRHKGDRHVTHAKGISARHVASIETGAKRTARVAQEARLSAGGFARSLWDRDTGIPARAWGEGVAAPGAMANPAAAEAVARRELAKHLAVLSPGATASDYKVIDNVVHVGMRTVAFQQVAGGLDVRGASVNFLFKNDRMMMMASTAMPNVPRQHSSARKSTATLARSASRWVSDAIGSGALTSAVGETVVLPLVKSAGNIEYRVATRVDVTRTDAVGQWDVYVDAATGAPIVRVNKIHFATGTLRYNVPVRNPAAGRADFTAGNATVTVNGNATTSSLGGLLEWAGNAAASVIPSIVGPLVSVTSETTLPAFPTLTLQPNGSVTWTSDPVEFVEAAASGFIHANLVKEYVRGIDPDIAYLDGTIPVIVNEAGECNAYSTLDDIHFFPRSAQCENTALLPDVVYHEFGHSLHGQTLVKGIEFDGALSEGASDYLAATIVNDSGMARGFFLGSNEPLRDVDPVGREYRWPEDGQLEVHEAGQVISGALWDLRKAAIEELGESEGIALTDKLFVAIIARSANMGVTYPEALAADDDDGNLGNGTPNECLIRSAFDLHGLADAGIEAFLPPPTVDGRTVSLAVTDPDPAAKCPGNQVVSVSMLWQPREGGPGSGGTIDLTKEPAGGENEFVWTGEIPQPEEAGVVVYRLTVNFSNDRVLTFPDNPADPNYETFIGATEVIWCNDFEGANDDWNVTLPWAFGGPAGGDDPDDAFDGNSILGTELAGTYPSDLAGALAISPPITLNAAEFTQVRLQYRRWLGVEESTYDEANLLVDGAVRWSNVEGFNHVDKEWRFHDLDVTDEAADGELELRWFLSSDGSVEFGGWNVDAVCIVGVRNATLPVCGNDVVEDGEECDDGNTVDGDGCSATCTEEEATPVCGNDIVEANEQCDDGNTEDGDGCSSTCEDEGANSVCGNDVVETGEECDDGNTDSGDGCSATCDDEGNPGEGDGGGCCSTSSDPRGALGLGLFTLGLVAMRRRRRRA